MIEESTKCGFVTVDDLKGPPSAPPKPRNVSGKFISCGQKEMIVQLHKNEKEKDPKQKYKDIIAKISEVTGIGRQSIVSTISEYKKTGKVSSPIKTRMKKSLFDKIDDLDRNGLRKKVHSIWLRRELPTIDKILSAVNEDPALPCFKRTSLYRVLQKLDFVSIKRKRCKVLTEREDLIDSRRNYLCDIRKYRAEGRTIYYLDEECVNLSDNNCLETAKTDVKTSRKHALKGLTANLTGKRLIVLHVGSKKGFLPDGLLCFESKTNSLNYLDEISGDDFRKWFKSMILNIDPNSVIVLDNAPCHSVEKENVSASFWNKADILARLESRGVSIDRPMLRAQLLVKLREVESLNKSYVIDDIAKDAGHTVLRLPPNHCEFNSILLAWAMVKGYVKQHCNSSDKIDNVRQILETAIDRVTAENWQHFIEQTIEEENKIWQVDDIMDEMLDSMETCAFKSKEETSSCDSSDEL